MSRWAAILVVAWLGGCSEAPVRIESKALGDAPDQSSERFIIAAVDNDPTAFVATAGGTPRGYDSVVPYGATSTARARMHALEKDFGLREVSEWPIEPLHMECAVLKIPDGADRATLLAGMLADPRVKLAQPLQTFSTRSGYNDPYLDLQRGFRQMDVIDAHSWSSGEGVKVAIIDTGADTQHQDLRGRITAADNFVDSDAEQFRRDRHGTEMAGVIAAVANNHEGIVGVAPDARLLLFKACWQLRLDADAANCNSFTLARALVAALDAHVQIVNLSLIGPDDPLLRGLIQEGMRRGILFVGAASDTLVGNAASRNCRASLRSLAPGPHPIRCRRVRSGQRHSDAYARRALRLRVGRLHRHSPGQRRSCPLLAKDRNLTAAATSKLLRDTSVRAEASGDGTVHVDACAAVVALVGRGSCPPDARIEANIDPTARVALH